MVVPSHSSFRASSSRQSSSSWMTGRREWHPSTDWYPTRTSDPSLVEQDAIAVGLLRHTAEEDEADWYPIANSSPEERYRSTTILQEEEEEEADHQNWSSTSSANASHSGTNAVSKHRRHKPQPTNNDTNQDEDEDRNVPDETERDTRTPDKTTQDTRTTTRNHPTKSRDTDRDRVLKEEEQDEQQEEEQDMREDDDQSLHLRSVALVAPDSETYALIRVNTSTKEKVQKWKRRQQERGSFMSGSSNSSTVEENDSGDQPPQPYMQDSASHSSSKCGVTTRKSRDDYSCSHYTDAGTCSSQSWTNLQRMQRSSSLPLFRSVPQPQSGSSNSNKSHPNPFGGSSMTRRTSSNQSAPSRSRTGKSLGGPAKSKDRTLPLRKGRSLGDFLSKKTLR